MVSASGSASRRYEPEGMRRGAGRVGPFSLVVADAAFAAPRERKGLSAAIPQIASLPGASPTFSHHGGAMLRIEGRSHAAHRGAEPCFALAAALTRGELTAPFLLRRPIPYSPPGHVCTPARLEWAARV